MAISDEQKRIYASAPNDDYLIETLSIVHVGLTGGARHITNCGVSFVGTLETMELVTFEAVPFRAIGPKSAEQNNLRLDVVIDNAGRFIMDELEAIASNPVEPLQVVYRLYLDSDRDTVQNDPPMTLSAMEVVATPSGVSFSAGIENMREKPFPKSLYDTTKFPGLAR